MTSTRLIRATSGTNLGGANAHNRRVMIDALRVNGPLSRADLARATQLTKQTVSNLIDDLDRDGLVKALDTRRSARGKPALPYTLVAEGAFALGLQIDRHLSRVVAVNLLGEALVQVAAPTPKDDPERGLAIILTLISAARQQLAALAPDCESRLVGLGVAMPGPFGMDVLPDAPWIMSAWHRFALVDRLAEATGLQIGLQNDAAAAATAERIAGAANGLDHAICIYLGYGLGAGLILNGERFGGLHGNAGEIGMALAAGPNGAALEQSVSLAALAAALRVDPSAPDLFEIIAAALARDDPALEFWLDMASSGLRWMVHLLESIFDPQTIIMCGAAPQGLIQRLIDRTQPLLPSLSRRETREIPRLQLGRADLWAVALGAAAAPIARVFDPRFAALLKGPQSQV